MNAQNGRSRSKKPAGKRSTRPAAKADPRATGPSLLGDLPSNGTAPPKGTPSQLEEAMAARRAHLAATIDELSARAQPKEIARRTSVGLREKLQSLTHTPDGDLRSERLAAVGGAVVVLVGVMAVLRRRR
jgi:hypothetical protein